MALAVAIALLESSAAGEDRWKTAAFGVFSNERLRLTR
jgi:hypothetical protein